MAALVRYASFGRKRVLILKNEDSDSFCVADSIETTSLKRQCSEIFSSFESENEKSPLESLPKDTLIKILCCVNHDDLKHLCHVSTTIREAAMIAKDSHFAYSTPTKIKAFRIPVEYEEPSEFDDLETPSAPKRPRHHKSKLDRNKLASASMSLFTSPKKVLFMKTEV